MNTIPYTYTTCGGASFVKKTVFKGSYIHIESILNSYILPISLVQLFPLPLGKGLRGKTACGAFCENECYHHIFPTYPFSGRVPVSIFNPLFVLRNMVHFSAALDWFDFSLLSEAYFKVLFQSSMLMGPVNGSISTNNE
jgi:hypothetical protein